MKNAPHPKLAHAFVDFMLSPDIQAIIAKTMLLGPVSRKVRLYADAAAKLRVINNAPINNNLPPLIQRWNTMIAAGRRVCQSCEGRRVVCPVFRRPAVPFGAAADHAAERDHDRDRFGAGVSGGAVSVAAGAAGTERGHVRDPCPDAVQHRGSVVRLGDHYGAARAIWSAVYRSWDGDCLGPFGVAVDGAADRGIAAADRSVVGASSADSGAGPLRTFFKVTLPLIRHALIAGALFSFIVSLDDVNIALFLSDIHVSPLSVQLLGYVQQSAGPLGAALASLLVRAAFAAIFVCDKTAGIDFLFGIRRGTL